MVLRKYPELENLRNGTTMSEPFDVEIRNLLEATFQAALKIQSDLTPEQLKLLIAATNLQSIANTFLLADERPDIQLNLKQTALGILGTKDWLEEEI